MGLLYFDRGGEDDPDRGVIKSRGVKPRASTLDSPPSESLGDLTRRAYGRNTQALRDRIVHANSSLDGTVRIPH